MKLLALGLAVVFAAGCATQPVGQKEVTRLFDKPFDKVWGATVASISGDFPFQVIEKPSGVLETQMVNYNPQEALNYALRPSILLGLWSQARGRLSFYVKPADETNTLVRISAHFEGFEFNTTHNWFIWPSKGTLEQSILEKIAAGSNSRMTDQH